MSKPEEILAFHMKALRMGPFERQYKFHPTLKWRFDFAWPEHKVAVEVEGGVSHAKLVSPKGTPIIGHHIHPEGFEHDCCKYNEATLLGWRLIRVTPRMVGSMRRGGSATEYIRRALAVEV